MAQDLALGLKELFRIDGLSEKQQEAYESLYEFIITQSDVYSQENIQHELEALNILAGIA